MKFLKNKKYFQFLVMLAFVFLASCAINLASSAAVIFEKVPAVQQAKTFPSLPVLGADTSFPVLSAQGVLAVDLNSGITLYEKNPDTQLLPASTTKIITALVSLDTYQLDQILTVGPSVSVDGQKMGLYTGEQIKFEDLLYGLLVYSANDSAEVLAENYPGSYEAFVAAMNAKAKDLSMTNSFFDNPVGLDTDGQHSTARDLTRVSEVAMRNPEFAKVVGTKNIIVTDATGKISYKLQNVNELLGIVPGVLGIKTGWTENARENLVTYIERDNHRVIIAILGSQDRFGETKELIDWIFSNYIWQEVKYP